MSARFRWRYQDDVMGEEWSDWHVDGPDCSTCCHGGPHDGEHQQAAGYLDESGIMDWYGHARCDPRDPDGLPVEWYPPRA